MPTASGRTRFYLETTSGLKGENGVYGEGVRTINHWASGLAPRIPERRE